ncbi:MAG: alpha-(1-_3)-arabinofuranosyltransferase family protein [Acidimicrobiales bacterium]
MSAAPGVARARRAIGDRGPLLVLAAVVYVPLLLTAPGRVGADTKNYLYLDPSRLLSRAWSMWDPNVGFGTVTHQTIGYLWPMGPWFWTAERLGLPDWLAQRLWLGTILFAAGAGTWWLLRRCLGWGPAAAAVAAFAYALTPYTLALAARISALLLPFAGLPWLIGLTILAVRRGGWRHPALFALVVATIGSVNATALVLAGLGPLLWLAHVRFVTGEASTRQVLGVTGRIGVLTTLTSLWWVAGLWAQGGWGIDILRYTETAETVSSSSVGAEVLRGLGYWFFYGGDRLGQWIEPGTAYTQNLLLIGLTFALPVAALAALARTRFAHRSFFVTLVVVGLVAAVGAHPWDDPSALGAVWKAVLRTDAGLALRSLPRAVPLLALGFAAGLGAGVASLATATAPALRRACRPIAYGAMVASVLALPPLWRGELVADNLDRPSEVPAYWQAAAAHLQAGADGSAGTRVLEVPGIDFGAYRWGDTVDPITPGLTDRYFVSRELIPYGSPPSADLLNAIDRNLQEGTLEPDAVTPLLRLAGVGEVVHRADTQFERYRTGRPYSVAALLDAAPGLGEPVGFGRPTVNVAPPTLPLIDELALRDATGEPRPPVEAYPVEGVAPLAHARSADDVVVVAGDAEGLVEAAGAGLLTGDELVRYAASLDADALVAAVDDAAGVVVTDANRRQGRRWSTLAANLGMVEAPGEEPLGDDASVTRLPVFPDAGDGAFTTAEYPGGVHARATVYGNGISLTPEYRPGQAVDGDPRTEWRAGAELPVQGERLELTFDPPVTATDVTLVQRRSGRINRTITEIDIRVDDGAPQRVALGEASNGPDGQVVTLDDGGQSFSRLEIELVADSSGLVSRPGRPARYTGQTAVGFAEIRVDGRVTDERWRLPGAALTAAADSDLAVVLARARTEPAEALREDPELALARVFELPSDRSFTLSGDARLSARARDFLLDDVLGVTGVTVTSSTRIPGDVAARASTAIDGDPATAWSPAYGDATPTLEFVTPAPVTVERLDLQVLDDGRRSTPSRLRVESEGGASVVVEVAPPAPGTDGRIAVALPEPVTGTRLRVVVEALHERSVIDWYSDEPVPVPVAIAELGIDGVAAAVPSGADRLDTGCRADLLTIDGEPVGVRITGTVADALARRPLTIETCATGPGGFADDRSLDLAAGATEVRAVPGLDTGIDLDRLVLRSDADGTAATATGPMLALPADDGPVVEVLDEGRTSMRLRVTGATPGEALWLVVGQSWNEGWQATSTDGGVELDEGPSQLVNGYANGWRVVPDGASFTVEVEWRPQRVVTAMLVASLLAVLLCLGLALRRHRRGATDGGTGDAGNGTDDAVQGVGATQRRFQGARPGVVATVATVLATGVVTALVVGPMAGVVTALAMAVGCRWSGARRWLVLAPPVLLAACAAFVLARRALAQPAPALEWPAELAATHQVAMVAVAILVVVVTCDRLWHDRPAPPDPG